MADLCITVWHWPSEPRWFDEGLKKDLALIRDAGFTHLNWNPDAGSSYWYTDAEIAFIARTIAEAGLKMHSVHASNGINPVTEFTGKGMGARAETMERRMDFASPHDWQRAAGVELIRNRIDLAVATGSPNVVLHLDVTDEAFASPEATDAFFRPVFESFDELAPVCRETGVVIAIENLFGKADGSNWLEAFGRLFDRYGADVLGLCYDSGHWELQDPGGLSVLERFGDRLVATHLHDNWGIGDDHLLPGDGRLDWDAIIRATAATPYTPPLNFETPKDRYAVSAKAFYQRAAAIARNLENKLAGARET